MKKNIILLIVSIFFIFKPNYSLAIEPDVFIQSTVNRATQTLSGNLTKDERIKKGRKHIDLHYTILRNDPGRNGRFIIQRNLFAEDPEEDF